MNIITSNHQTNSGENRSAIPESVRDDRKKLLAEFRALGEELHAFREYLISYQNRTQRILLDREGGCHMLNLKVPGASARFIGLARDKLQSAVPVGFGPGMVQVDRAGCAAATRFGSLLDGSSCNAIIYMGAKHDD